MWINKLNGIVLPVYMSKRRLWLNYINLRIRTIVNARRDGLAYKVSPWNYMSLPPGIWGEFTKLFVIYFNSVSPRFILDSFVVKRTMLPATANDISFAENLPIIKEYFEDTPLPRVIQLLTIEVPRIFKGVSSEMLDRWLWSYYWPFYLFRNHLSKDAVFGVMPVELGGGTGLFGLSFGNSSSKNVVMFDLPAVLHLQAVIKSILGEHLVRTPTTYPTNNISDLQPLISQTKYAVVSYWAFTEYPRELRDQFIPLIMNSEFSIFAANKSFEGVSNKEYFDELITKIPGKSVYYAPIDWSSSKSHSYVLIK